MDKSRSIEKPFPSYNGGKEGDGCFQKIINLIPPHEVYIEAFLGNGAILRKKRPAEKSIGIDIDPNVITRWQKIDFPGLTLANSDAISFLEQLPAMASMLMNKNVFVYLDPPYPIDARKSQLPLYNFEMSTADHTRLLDVVTRLAVPVMISTYDNEQYREKLSSWNKRQFKTQTRSGTATETLYFNYQVPQELHDYRYLGNDFREREKFKHIIDRNVKKFQRIDPILRNAILEKILSPAATGKTAAQDLIEQKQDADPIEENQDAAGQIAENDDAREKIGKVDQKGRPLVVSSFFLSQDEYREVAILPSTHLIWADDVHMKFCRKCPAASYPHPLVQDPKDEHSYFKLCSLHCLQEEIVEPGEIFQSPGCGAKDTDVSNCLKWLEQDNRKIPLIQPWVHKARAKNAKAETVK